MPRHYTRPVGSRPYKNYTEETLKKILEEIRSKKISVRGAAEKYGIHRNTLSSKLKGKAPRKPGGQTVFSEEEESGFISHIIALSSFGFPITVLELRVSVKSYLDKQGRKVKAFKDNFPGKEWAHSFMKRHKTELSNRVARNITHGRAEINEEIINDFFNHYEKEAENVPDTNIWNYDETCLVDDPGSSKVLTRRGTKYPEIIKNSSKASTSIMICGSAAGEVAPVYVVYKAENMWATWTENGPPNARYNRTKSGWFDARCFEDWFEFTMLPILKKQTGKKILVGDNLSSHLSPQVISACQENNIAFIALPPNATHLLQPLDVAYFRPMKIAWRKILNEWKSNTRNSRTSCVPKDQFPMLLKQMFVHMNPNSSQNLKSGFKKCGLYPLDRDPVLKRMPDQQLEASLPVRELLSESFLESLRTTRRQVTETRQYRRRRRVNVPAGRGITAADLEVDTTVTRTVASSALYADPDHSTDSEINSPTRTHLVTADIEPEIERTAPIAPSYAGHFYSDHSTDCEVDTPSRTNLEVKDIAPEIERIVHFGPSYAEHLYSDHTTDCEIDSPTPKNLEAADIEPELEKTAPIAPSYAVQFYSDQSTDCEIDSPIRTTTARNFGTADSEPYPPTNGKNVKAPEASQSSTGIEPQPSGSGLNTRRLKGRHPDKPEKKRKISKSKRRSNKKGTASVFIADSTSNSSCSSYISYQESDCSENWCDFADLQDDVENDFQRMNRIPEKKSEKKVDLTKLKPGSYVLAEYDENVYPGKVLQTLADSVLISAMQKSGHNTWKWPKPEDVIWYNHSKIISYINEPTLISKRGLFRIPELVKKDM